MTMERPTPDESAVTVEEVRAALHKAGVVYGVQDDLIPRGITDEAYGTSVKVAAGDPPRKGTDATIEYFFDRELNGTPCEDQDGRIDYRNLNLIQSVEKGALLARKTAPTAGVNGRGVDGTELPAPRGRNFQLTAGANTALSADGCELRATASGAIVARRGVIEVTDVVTIDGDVDFNVGNIDCTGSVRIAGNVNAGFTVRVGGNLEIGGNVQDCRIHCRGNILIRGGCFGKGEGRIQADADITVKYAERAGLSCGGDLIVGEELLHCQVEAGKRVWVRGSRGKILGGSVSAGQQIRAAIIGSDAGTPTTLRIRQDTKLLEHYHQLTREIERLEADRGRVKRSIAELRPQHQAGKLSSVQKKALKKLIDFHRAVPVTLEKLHTEKGIVEQDVRETDSSVIIADKSLYPGVKAYFGSVYTEVSETLTARTLRLKDNLVEISQPRPA
jgi:uncharacterized protein (DUF342 family)